MNKIRKKIKNLIDRNRVDLENSHAKFGGVYIESVGEDDYVSLEVELDEGNIAFSLESTNGQCHNCGHEEFLAEETAYNQVVCNSHKDILSRESTSSDGVCGPYECKECGEVYNDLDELNSSEETLKEVLVELLMDSGIGVYREKSDWELVLAEAV